jgi:O-acetylserine/cysteine efflux transporter
MKKTDLFLGILVTAIWGANFSVIKLGLSSLDPFLLTAFRFLLCSIPLIFFVKKPDGVSMKIMALYGSLFGVGLWGMVNLGIYLGLSAGLASLVLQFSAFFTILMSTIFFKEKISNLQFLGVIVSLCGLLFIFTITDGNISYLGLFLVILGAISWSMCNIIIKKHKPSNMFSFIVWSSIFSATPLFLITLLIKGVEPFYGLRDSLNSASIFSILFQAYITTIFGYYVWNAMMRKYPVSSVAPLSLNVPIFGLITSYLVFDENIAANKIVAAALIISGIAIFLFAPKLKLLLKTSTLKE